MVEIGVVEMGWFLPLPYQTFSNTTGIEHHALDCSFCQNSDSTGNTSLKFRPSKATSGWICGGWVFLSLNFYGSWFFFFFCLGFIAKILLLVFCLGFIDDILLRWLQNFSSVICGSSVYCWVVVLGLGWWWVDEKERKTERRRTKMKREERRERDFFILFYSVIYIILIYCR